MHEIALWSLPLLGAPLLAVQRWMAGRRAPAAGPALGERVAASGSLPAADGTQVRLQSPAPATVLVFMANRCPGVKAYDGRLRELWRRFSPQGVRFVGVNSVPEQLYPGESLDGMRRAAKARGIPFPYAKDADQALMRLLGARCTPQVFLLDGDGRLRYRGRIDDSFVEAKARAHDLRDALNDVLAHRPVERPETPPLGCSIDVAPASSPSSPHSRGIPA